MHLNKAQVRVEAELCVVIGIDVYLFLIWPALYY